MDFDKYTRDLKSQSLAIFVGAGISFNSNIPTVLPLTQYILKQLDIKNEHVETYLKRGYPFEGLVESLKFYLKDIDPLLETFNVQAPTSNHFFIAELIKAGIAGSVYTTNFDLNIELACEALGLVEGRDFKVFYDPAKFKDVQFDEPVCKVFKLHGSIQNKSDLGVTLENIASKRYPFVLEPIMEYLFNFGPHDNILYMGYSFSDKFDIQPLMSELNPTSKHVTVIEHSSEERPDIYLTEPLFQRSPIARRVYVNTNKFVDEIGFRIFGRKFSDKVASIDPSIWQQQVDKWLAVTMTGKGLQNPISIAAALFSRIDERQIFKEFVNRGLQRLEDGLDDNKFACDMLARRATVTNAAHADLEELKTICKCLDRAIKYARLDHSVNDEMTHIGNIAVAFGYLYFKLKEQDPSAKVEYYKNESIRLASGVFKFYESNREHLESGVEKYFGVKMNMAVLNRKFDKPEISQKMTEEILNETRDRHGSGMALIKSASHYNLGRLFQQKGNVDMAVHHYERSLKTGNDVGLKERVYFAFREAISLIDKHRGRAASTEFLSNHNDVLTKFDIKFEW